MPILARMLSTPWKAWNELWYWFTYPPIRLLFIINGIKWGKNWRLYGMPVILKHRHSQMRFGANLQLRSSLLSNPLGPFRSVIIATWSSQAVVEIGEDFGMTGGTICAAQRIIIGNHVIIGANSTIIDTDFHPIDPVERRSNPSSANTAPIVIEDNVFVGMNCLILKGVTIGHDSVIGAASVVTRDVPPAVLVAGNPAQVIRLLTIK